VNPDPELRQTPGSYQWTGSVERSRVKSHFTFHAIQKRVWVLILGRKWLFPTQETRIGLEQYA
jgi:hypothetical protein